MHSGGGYSRLGSVWIIVETGIGRRPADPAPAPAGAAAPVVWIGNEGQPRRLNLVGGDPRGFPAPRQEMIFQIPFFHFLLPVFIHPEAAVIIPGEIGEMVLGKFPNIADDIEVAATGGNQDQRQEKRQRRSVDSMGNPLSAQKLSSVLVPLRTGDNSGGMAGDVIPPANRPGRIFVIHRAVNLGFFPHSGNLFFPLDTNIFYGIPD